VEVAADRGGSFGRIGRSRLRYGTTFETSSSNACDPAESSPVGGARKLRRALILVASALAAYGVITLAEGLQMHAKAALAQVLLQGAWERARHGAAAPRPWPWADTYPIARLSAPAQHVELFVLAGANGRTLAFGPGHHDGSALPGEAGNVVLTGHRDTHFGFLRELRAGDALELESARGRRERYRVRDVAVVDYRDLRLPRWTAELTLVTCYPFDAIAPGGPLRYVVTAAAE
jgi:sortase A